jgi:polyisoprenoid-binding protein YceI
MPRMMKWTALLAALWVAGCANPADDKFKATATAPQPVAPPAPESAAPPATAAGTDATLTSATATATATAAAPSSRTIPISSEGSKIEFIGSKVSGSHNGGFKAFSGTAELTPDATGLARVHVVIDMDSTWTDNPKLTGHLKSPDFFDVPQFPKAEFVSTEIATGAPKGASHMITGNLTLHGVTKSISFPATIAVSGDALTIASEFAINRKDFGITYPGKRDDLIRDEVVIKLDIKRPKA